jgi:hypothetical protein
MPLAAFFTKSEPEAFPLLEIILDVHPDRSADANKGIDHEADERPAPKPHGLREIDAVKKFPGFLRRKDSGLAFLTTCLGPRTDAAGFIGMTWPRQASQRASGWRRGVA